MAHRSFPDPVEVPPERITDRLVAYRATSRAQRLVAATVVVLLAGAGWWLLRPAPPAIEATIPVEGAGAVTAVAASGPSGPASGPIPSTATTIAAAEVVVQVAGAIDRPGVYRLAEGDRVDDLIRIAGGFAADADRARLNLAAPLTDGARVWVPARGETEIPEVVDPVGGGGGTGGGGAGGGGSSVPSADAPVDLNAADAAQLEELPGVGPATSAAIIAHRDEHGPFASVEELLDVRGIGEAKLEQLRPLVTV